MRNWEKPRLFFISHGEIEKLSRQVSVGRIKRKQRCLFAKGNGRAQRQQQWHYASAGHAQGHAGTHPVALTEQEAVSPESSVLLYTCCTEPQGGHEPCGIFFFNLCFKDHAFLMCMCVCERETCFSSMPSTALSFNFSCWLKVWFHSGGKKKANKSTH